MKRCPHCGAQLQEEARFCLYCMRSLENKPDVTPHAIEKKRWWWLVATAVAVASLAVLLLCLPKADKSQTDAAFVPSTQTDAASSSPTQMKGAKQRICTVADFHSAISYDDPLWEPYWAMQVGSIEQWDSYFIPFHLADARLDLYLYREGERVCAALSGIPEPELMKAAGIADDVIDIVCCMYEKGGEKAHISGERLTAGESVDAEVSLIGTVAPGDPLGYAIYSRYDS